MSLYEDIEVDWSPEKKAAASTTAAQQQKQKSAAPTPTTEKPATTTPVSKMNLSFLKSQLEAKKVLLQNAAVAAQQKSALVAQSAANVPPTPPGLLTQPQLHQQKLAAGRQQKSVFKLKPHKAVPLPLDSSGAFTIVPKALKEDKVFLFGEIMVEDEYNPTAPTEYGPYKQKREQQKLKEKIAKEIADRLARETAEEDEKRKRGATFAPPSAWAEDEAEEEEEVMMEEVEAPKPQPPAKLTQFGKGVSRGLGVAASIMSRMGYREGQGLGANKQGISRPLEVQRTGRNVGLIVAEEKAQTVVTHLGEPAPAVESSGGSGGWAERPVGEQQPITPTMALLKGATKIVLLENMLCPDQEGGHGEEAEFEQKELREEMAKYGQLVNVLIHRRQQPQVAEGARVFLEFSNQAQAIKAVVDLNGRFYAGRQVRARFYPLDEFNERRLDE